MLDERSESHLPLKTRSRYVEELSDQVCLMSSKTKRCGAGVERGRRQTTIERKSKVVGSDSVSNPAGGASWHTSRSSRLRSVSLDEVMQDLIHAHGLVLIERAATSTMIAQDTVHRHNPQCCLLARLGVESDSKLTRPSVPTSHPTQHPELIMVIGFQLEPHHS